MFKEYFYLKKKVKLHLRNDLPKKVLFMSPKVVIKMTSPLLSLVKYLVTWYFC